MNNPPYEEVFINQESTLYIYVYHMSVAEGLESDQASTWA